MIENENEITTISVKRRTSSRFGIMQAQLKFHSADDFIRAIIDGVIKAQWTKFDIELFQKYGQIPIIITGSARNDAEMLHIKEKLGFKEHKEIQKPEKPKIKKVEKPNRDLEGINDD